MFDPAMLGTLRIGLDAIAAEARADERGRPPARPRPARTGLRVGIAHALRRAADLLEPRPMGHAAP